MVCQYLDFCFLHEAVNVTSSDILLKYGHQFHRIFGIVDYSNSTSLKDGGPLGNSTVKVQLTDKNCPLLKIAGEKVLLKLFTSSGDSIILGSLLYPLKYTVKTHPSIEITFELTGEV